MKQQYKTVFLNFGYAEDASIAYIPMAWTGKPFTKKADAIVSLANHFKKRWMGDVETYRHCCKPYKKLDKNYCADCGRDLQACEFDMKDFQNNFLKQLPGKTCDSYGYDDDSEDHWTTDVELDSFPKTTLILCAAEKIFAAALDDIEGLEKMIVCEDNPGPNVILG